jgi:hypothetical protein
MLQRKPNSTLKDHLFILATSLKDEANSLPPGPVRDSMIRKARQTETASHLDEWLASPGLQSPK